MRPTTVSNQGQRRAGTVFAVLFGVACVGALALSAPDALCKVNGMMCPAVAHEPAAIDGPAEPHANADELATTLRFADIDAYQTTEPLRLLPIVLQAHRFSEIETAAAAGDPEAMFLVSVAKGAGVGTPLDKVMADSFLNRSADAGFPAAQTRVAARWTKAGNDDLARGVERLTALANNGAASAQLALGDYYLVDAIPGVRDRTRARRLFEAAAQRGNAEAISRLGQLSWLEDDGTAAAVRLYEAAAEAGSSSAQFWLAEAIDAGAVGARNPSRTLALYRRAANAGQREAALAASKMLAEGLGVARDAKAAEELLQAAVAAGDWAALARLSHYRLDGSLAGSTDQAARDAVTADEHGQPEGLVQLLQNLNRGANGSARDPVLAGTLARAALERFEARPITSEGAEPAMGVAIARILQASMIEGAVASEPAERDRLASIYGSPNTREIGLLQPFGCGGLRRMLGIVVFDGASVNPAEAQYEWLEKAKGCGSIDYSRMELATHHRQSIATGASFVSLVEAAARARAERLSRQPGSPGSRTQ